MEIKYVSFRSGWILLGLMTALGIALAVIKPPLGIATLAVCLIYFGTCLHEVRAPDVAFLYKMGAMAGQIPAGWYLTIPHLWTIEAISRETFEIFLPDQEMYTQAKRPIKLTVRIFYRLEDLNKALLTRKVIHHRVQAVVLSKLKGVVGGKTFSELLLERGELEKAIMTDVNEKELAPDGYQVTGVEIEDLDENVESRAEVIREIGRAHGDAARALAEPLRDNYPAAAVSAMGTLAEATERVITTIWGRQATQPAQPPSLGRGEGSRVAQQLTEAAREITEHRR